jgi:hypothetical protein
MIRRLVLRLVVLMVLIGSLVILSAGFTSNKAKASACTDFCADVYNTSCVPQCGGHQVCLRICRDEYRQCMCGCGIC